MGAPAFELIGLVSNGKLPIDVVSSIGQALRRSEGKRVAVTLREVNHNLSGNQNRNYWGVVVAYVLEMFQDAGNDVDAEQVHEFLKEHVGQLEAIITDPTGKRRRITGSSAGLSTMAFEEY